MPTTDDAFVKSVSDRYIELYERITGQCSVPADTSDIPGRMQRALKEYLG